MKKLLSALALLLFTLLVFTSCSGKDSYPLHTLVRTGTEKQIKAFLSSSKRAKKYINMVSDKNLTPICEALTAGRDVAVIRLLIEGGSNLSDPNELQKLYEDAANRGDYTIIQALVAGGMPLPYSEDWGVFIEQVYTSTPETGTYLASYSLRYPPDVHNERYLKNLWPTIDADLQQDPSFILFVLQRASSDREFIYTIVDLIKEITKDKERTLSFFDYLGRNTSTIDRQEYIAQYFSRAEANAREHPEKRSEIFRQLREDIALILKYYTIDLNFELTASAGYLSHTPLNFALLNDQELAKLLILRGANPNYPSDIRYLPKYEPDSPYYLSRADEYVQLLDAFKPAGLLQAITALQSALDQRDYAKAETLLDQYPGLKDPDIYIYFDCTKELYPVMRYLNAMDEKTLTFLFEHDFYPGYSYFITDFDSIEYSIQRASIVSWIIREGNAIALRFLLNRKFENYLASFKPEISWDDIEYTIKNGNLEMLSIFKKIGITLTERVYKRNDYSNAATDLSIHTLLHTAVENDHANIVRFLIQEGADVNALSMYSLIDSSWNMSLSFSTTLDYAESDEIRNLLTTKGAISFNAILQNPSQYKKFIEEQNLPTIRIFAGAKVSLRAHDSSKSPPSSLEESKFYVLGTLENGEGLVVLDESFNLWDLVQNNEEENEDAMTSLFYLKKMGYFDNYAWYFKEAEPITIHYLE